MKVLIINGSPRKNGNTNTALLEMIKIFNQENIETELIQVGHLTLSGCVSCGYCHKNGQCIKNDLVNEVNKKFEEADGLVIASPVYFASPNGTLLAFLDRLFYSARFDKTMKVGASVVCCRRGGASSSFDVLNKYFTISSMPVVSSTYWNSIHGRKINEAIYDEEGLLTMRTLARNMSFLIKAISEYKKTNSLPVKEERVYTNFIKNIDEN